jgi:hypothetical protein
LAWAGSRARSPAEDGTETRPTTGDEFLANLVQGTVYKILGQEEIKPHKAWYYLERRDVDFDRKWPRFGALSRSAGPE